VLKIREQFKAEMRAVGSSFDMSMDVLDPRTETYVRQQDGFTQQR